MRPKDTLRHWPSVTRLARFWPPKRFHLLLLDASPVPEDITASSNPTNAWNIIQKTPKMVNWRSDGKGQLAAAVLFVTLDTTAVILRFASKARTKRRFAVDDAWIVSALLFFYGYAALILYCMAGVAGTLDFAAITDPRDIEQVLKTLWVSEVFFILTITSLKISILCFYRSIFTTPKFSRVTQAISIICGLWLFTGFWVTIFQCRPARAVHDLKLAAQAHCIKYGYFCFIWELGNALIDVSILALPIYMIRRLHLPLRRKIQVLSIFLMGGFVLITCVVRMVYILDPKEPHRVASYTRSVLWSTIELGVALICACLPTYGPLLAREWGLLSTLQSWYTSLLSSAQSQKQRISSTDKTRASSDRFNDKSNTSMDKVQLARDGAGAQNEFWHGEAENQYPLNSITVEKRIDVV